MIITIKEVLFPNQRQVDSDLQNLPTLLQTEKCLDHEPTPSPSTPARTHTHLEDAYFMLQRVFFLFFFFEPSVLLCVFSALICKAVHGPNDDLTTTHDDHFRGIIRNQA